MLSFILGGCGTGKSTVLLDRLRRDLEAGLDVMVLVPEQFSFEEEKKLYAALGPVLFNRMETRSFATLSRQILDTCAGGARSYATEQEKLLYLYLAVQECLEEGRFRALARRFGSHAFLTESFSLITKLRRAGVSGEQLIDLSPDLPDLLSDKTHDLGQLLYAYDRVLAAHDRRDSLADLTQAAALAQMHYYFEGKQLYLDEFDSFTGDQYQMLAVCLEQAENVTAAIRADLPGEKPSGVFTGGCRTYENLRRMAQETYHLPVDVTACRTYCRSRHADLRTVSESLLHRRPEKAAYEGHVHLFAAKDPEGEAEYICAEICRLLSEDSGLRCRDIAVALKEPEHYAHLFTRAMERYALPYDLAEPRPVYHTELVRFFLTLLTLLTESTPRTETILRYVKSPLSGCPLEAASMLEHYCYTWSVEGTYWETPFGAEEALNEEMAQQFDLPRLEALRASLMDELSALRDACRGSNVRRICKGLYTFLQKHEKAYTPTLEGVRRQEFITVWNLLCECMDTVVGCLGEMPLSVRTLSDSFRLLLQSISFSTPPQTLDSVRIVRAATSRLNAPRIVFMPDFCTGVYPADVSIGGFFTGQELEQLERRTGVSIARLLPELHSDELLILTKLLSAPSEQLYLTYPAVNTAGESSLPSPAADTLMRLFPGQDALCLHAEEVALHTYVYTPAGAYYHLVRHLREDSGETAALRRLLEDDPAYARRLQRLSDAQPGAALSVSSETMQAMLGEKLVLSPSGIDQFFHCPFAYFCGRCLKLYSPERISLSVQKIGSFSHYCLEQILRRYAPEQFIELTQAQLREEITQLSEVFSGANFSDAVRRDGRFQLNYHMTGQGILPMLLHLQKELRESAFRPAGFEVPVDAAEGALPPLKLDDGRIVCRGRIDRVDICHTQEGDLMRVVDYKTGRKFFSPEKLADGLDMQMLIYLFALGSSGAYDGAKPGGVLYSPSGQLRKFDSRGSKARAPQEILEEHFRMKGLMLDTAAPLMEAGLAEQAVPVLESASGKQHLYSVTAPQMERLQTLVEQNILRMAKRLHSGDVAPAPYLYEEYTPCGYCGYADICGSAQTETVKRSEEETVLALKAAFGEGREGEEA
ncbi:MAG: PD-(D/E)XK nuclease family protein [Oscillospiraceae bacterium]|nr:PD-(D/E)XK nuclease family protein [Oscillospiraceae bacterium]